MDNKASSPRSNASPRSSSSSSLRHPIQLGQFQWKGFPYKCTGLHHSPFLAIRPVGFRNLNHRSGGSISIPHASLNNTASSTKESKNLQKQIDLDKIACGKDTRTTIVISNIPQEYTREMLFSEFENHKECFDFIYFPMDLKNRGYALINIPSPLHIVKFYQDYHGKKWEKFTTSDKVASVEYAWIQGNAEELALYFQNMRRKAKTIMTMKFFHPRN